MKKMLKKTAVFLSALILFSCSGKNGTFTSKSTGFGGEVAVSVSVKDGTITNVKATGETIVFSGDLSEIDVSLEAEDKIIVYSDFVCHPYWAVE